MAWRDDLRPASFRGVPFEVSEEELTAGRRLARHEFPQRDVPFLEDMGRRAREIKVRAFVLGPDYRGARDRLLAAIEEAGSGQLVLPRQYMPQAVVHECKLSETTAQGGMAVFDLTFVEAGSARVAAAPDREGALNAADDFVVQRSQQEFVRQFSIAGKPEWVAESSMSAIRSALSKVRAAQRLLDQAVSDPTSLLTNLLPENLRRTLNDSLLLARSLQAMARDIDALSGYTPVIGPDLSAPYRQADNRNVTAIGAIIRQASVLGSVMADANAEHGSREDGQAAQRRIILGIDSVLHDDATGQDAADAFLALRQAALALLADSQPTLPVITYRQLADSVPVLVLAHAVYGDDFHADARDAEIVARNNIRHPGFLLPGSRIALVA